MDRPFLRFGFDHWLGILLVVVECLLVAWLCRTRPDQRRGCGALLAGVTLLYIFQAYYHRWNTLLPAESLPLHLCDVVILLGLAAVWQSARGREPSGLAREWVYFWGCGLTGFAILTPDLHVGFPHWRFLEFFWGHGLIFWHATYLMASHGMPERARHWATPLRASVGILLYILVVGVVNYAFGWNYGYLCQKPPGSILDVMGPWPLYLGVGLLLATLEFYVLWLPLRFSPRQSFGPGKRG